MSWISRVCAFKRKWYQLLVCVFLGCTVVCTIISTAHSEFSMLPPTEPLGEWDTSVLYYEFDIYYQGNTAMCAAYYPDSVQSIVVVPESVPVKGTRLPVTSIDNREEAFSGVLQNDSNAEILVIPDSVQYIRYLGKNCPNLKSVALPNGKNVVIEGLLDDSSSVVYFVIENSAAQQYCIYNGLNYQLRNEYQDYKTIVDGVQVFDKAMFATSLLTLPRRAGDNRNIPVADEPNVTENPDEKPIIRMEDVVTTIIQPPAVKMPTVGEVVRFGNYYSNSASEKDPIEWQVLDVEGNRALLISVYGLETKPYHDEKGVIDAWGKSSLRAYLNSTFLNEAFSKKEQQAIVLSKVSNADGWYAFQRNDNDNYNGVNVIGGADTQDKIFVLSVGEVLHYFPAPEDRCVAYTKYLAQKPGDPKKGTSPESKPANYKETSNSYWWLRDVNEEYRPKYIETRGLHVLPDGKIGTTGVLYYTYYVVRPAIWVDWQQMQ